MKAKSHNFLSNFERKAEEWRAKVRIYPSFFRVNFLVYLYIINTQKAPKNQKYTDVLHIIFLIMNQSSILIFS